MQALPLAKTRVDILAPADGYVAKFNCERIGIAAITLGAGRRQATDSVEPTAGIEVHRKVGEPIRRGEKLFTLYGAWDREDGRFREAEKTLLEATTISLQNPEVSPLIAKRKVV